MNIRIEKHESQSIKLYLTLFYLLYFFYNFFTYSIVPRIYPKFKTQGELDIGITLLLVLLLPIAIYLYKSSYRYMIKYIYFIAYTLVALIIDLSNFFENPIVLYETGNVVEYYWLILAPIFVNKMFFKVVTFGTIAKIVIVAIIIKDPVIFAHIIFITIFSILGYLLLIRFELYINSLTTALADLRKKEKLAMIGTLATSIGHEIRNPLAALKGFTQLQLEKFKDDQQYPKIMLSEVERINTISNNLLVLGRNNPLVLEKNRIEDIIAETYDLQKIFIEQNNITVRNQLEDNLPSITCDRNRLVQVFGNFIKQVIDIMPVGGSIENTVTTEGTQVVILMLYSSTELGIEEKMQDSYGESTSLAILVTQKIIEDHHGSMEFIGQSNDKVGIKILLPISE